MNMMNNSYQFLFENTFTEIVDEINKSGINIKNYLDKPISEVLKLEPDQRISDLGLINPGKGDVIRLSFQLKEDSFLLWFILDFSWKNNKFYFENWRIINNITFFFDSIDNDSVIIHLCLDDFIYLFKLGNYDTFNSIISTLTSIYYGVAYWGQYWKDLYISGKLLESYKALYGKIKDPKLLSDNKRIKIQIKLLFLIDHEKLDSISPDELWILTEAVDSYYPSDERYKIIDKMYYSVINTDQERELFKESLNSFLEKRLEAVKEEKIIYNAQDEMCIGVLELIQDLSGKYGLEPQILADGLLDFCGSDAVDLFKDLGYKELSELIKNKKDEFKY